MAKLIIKLVNSVTAIINNDPDVNRQLKIVIEIRDEVGAENFFQFGLGAAEVTHIKGTGYQPVAYYQGTDQLRAAIDLIASGFLSR